VILKMELVAFARFKIRELVVFAGIKIKQVVASAIVTVQYYLIVGEILNP